MNATPHTTVTLDDCAREPIHIPGAIQPHGALLVVHRASLTVEQASANAQELLGIAAQELLGKPLALHGDAQAAELGEAIRRGAWGERGALRVAGADGGALEASVHVAPGDEQAVVVELEPQGPLGEHVYHAGLRGAVARLHTTATLAELYARTVREVRALTGFDRVMVYRFSPDYHGEVVAEAKRADLESFLGLHYPASDIPAQARALYERNWLRLIADVNYAPARLVPALNPRTGRPLDMSDSVLRSVSPIHVEYLSNMGVRASMSISLITEGKLIGLIACHHYAGPRLVGYSVREAALYLGQALSFRIAAHDRAAESTRRAQTALVESELTRRLNGADNLHEALNDPALLALAGADGAAVVLGGRVTRLGRTPDEADLARLAAYLRDAPLPDVFATEKLSSVTDLLAHDAEVGGVLAVPIARKDSEYVFWFRRPEDRTVHWAGEPVKVEHHGGEGPPRLSPRGSFALWQETVRGSAPPWARHEVEAASNLRKSLLEVVRRREAALETRNGALLAADRAKDEFLATVSHELRTPLNAIVGWASLLQGGTLSDDRATHALSVILRNAQAQATIVNDLLDVSRMVSGTMHLQASPVDLAKVVRQALEAVGLSAAARAIQLDVRVGSTPVTVLGDEGRLRQVLVNLLTNAIKFSDRSGAVSVALASRHGRAELSVRDHGQGMAAEFVPHVFELFRQEDGSIARMRQGLGLGLAISKRIVDLHGGTIRASSGGRGLGSCFELELPLVAGDTEGTHGKLAQRADRPQRLAQLRVLVVEDELDSSDLLVTVLGAAGALCTACARAADALAILAERHFDVLISDVGLPELDGYRLIRSVRAQGGELAALPAVALTAYGSESDRQRARAAGFDHHLTKPLDAEALIDTLRNACGRGTEPGERGSVA